MKNSNKNKKIFIPLIIVLVLTISCNMPIIGSRMNSQTMEGNINLNPDMQTGQLNNTDNNSNREYVSVQISEDELTTLLNQELEQNPEFGLSNAKVLLRDGFIQITGQVNRSGISLPLKMNIQLIADEQSHLNYKITSAQLGPLPLPDYFVDQASNQIEQAISKISNFDRNTFTIEHIMVENGILFIDGYIQT
jgi:uncharacterized protein YpmS